MAFAFLLPSPVFFFNVNLRIIKRLGESLNVVASFLFLDLFFKRRYIEVYFNKKVYI